MYDYIVYIKTLYLLICITSSVQRGFHWQSLVFALYKQQRELRDKINS